MTVESCRNNPILSLGSLIAHRSTGTKAPVPVMSARWVGVGGVYDGAFVAGPESGVVHQRSLPYLSPDPITMDNSVTLDQFLTQAADGGPCVGVCAEAPSSSVMPPSIELRTIDGARTTTLDGLFDAFAEAWHFPPWFGRNAPAFDDFMRDLDNMIDVALGRPPAAGYVTEITAAHRILVEQPNTFSWFAHCIPFYRDYYRNEASPPATFCLLLSAPSGELQGVRERWLGVGVHIATVAP